MAKLRFIKPWGNFKPGDIKVTDSPTTIHYLTKVYQVAVIDKIDEKQEISFIDVRDLPDFGLPQVQPKEQDEPLPQDEVDGDIFSGYPAEIDGPIEMIETIKTEDEPVKKHRKRRVSKVARLQSRQ